MKKRILIQDVGIRSQLLYYLDGLMIKNEAVSTRWFCRISFQVRVGMIGNDLPISYLNSGCVQGQLSHFRPRKVRIYTHEIYKQLRDKKPVSNGIFSHARNAWSFKMNPVSYEGLGLNLIMASYDNVSLQPVVNAIYDDCDKFMSIVAGQFTRHAGVTAVSEMFTPRSESLNSIPEEVRV